MATAAIWGLSQKIPMGIKTVASYGLGKKPEPESLFCLMAKVRGRDSKRSGAIMNIRKHFLTVRGADSWHRLPSKAVEYLHPCRFSKAIWTQSWQLALGVPI